MWPTEQPIVFRIASGERLPLTCRAENVAKINNVVRGQVQLIDVLGRDVRANVAGDCDRNTTLTRNTAYMR